MEFFFYRWDGVLVNSIIAYGMEHIDWNKFVDEYQTGGYFVVGKDRGEVKGTYFVDMTVTNISERVIYKGFPNSVDIVGQVEEGELDEYGIAVSGFLPGRDGQQLVKINIPCDEYDRVPELPRIVKFFTDDGKRVFCCKSGNELAYVYPVAKIDVKVTTLG